MLKGLEAFAVRTGALTEVRLLLSSLLHPFEAEEGEVGEAESTWRPQPLENGSHSQHPL